MSGHDNTPSTGTWARRDLSGFLAADAMAAVLKAAEVPFIFGQSCPTALFLAAAKLGIGQIGYRTENAGVAMADGYARASGKVGVITAQNGPAAGLLVAGLCEAQKASVPIVAIVQDVPRANTDKNAFQEIDHEQIFRGCAKWVRKVVDPARAGEYMMRAIMAATAGRPGPAVLLVPFDVLLEQVAPVTPDRPLADGPLPAGFGHYPVDRHAPAPELMQLAAQWIADGERPLIVAGGGVHTAQAAATLAKLQSLWQVPVATTNMGKGAVDETDPLSIGVIGNCMGTRSPFKHQRDYVQRADVVLFVGTRTNENGTASWSLFDRDAKFIQIDVDPEELGRNYRGLRLLGDADTTLQALLGATPPALAERGHRNAPAIRQAISRARALSAAELAPFEDSAQTPLRPERLFKELRACAPDALWVSDASYSSLWILQYLQARRSGDRFLTPRGIAGLGWGYPMALGARLAQPARPVIAVVGDGGFSHCWAEIETARRHGIQAVVIVLNNGVLGFQRDAEQSRFGVHTEICHFGPIDHVAIARGCGGDGIRVTQAEEIAPALARALAATVPMVIDVDTAPEAFPPIQAFESLNADVAAQA
ncbi:MAG TPA: acetolactate synthase catalytic subunit [Bordetella sp.]